jgi:hypothetical protein
MMMRMVIDVMRVVMRMVIDDDDIDDDRIRIDDEDR